MKCERNGQVQRHFKEEPFPLSLNTIRVTNLIEIIADAYFKLNNVVDDYNRLLEENKNAQELATGAERAELIKKEIQLTKAQIDAKQALVDAYAREAQGIRKSRFPI